MATAELPPARSTELPLEPEMHPLVKSVHTGQPHNLVTVGDAIGNVVLDGNHPRGWWIGFLAGFAMLQVLALAVCWLFYMGVGIWGINVPVAWGFAIVNFVWWIGIGHAGTLISAVLLLLHQKWRTSINRFSEAMTIFAVMCAGLFPLLHMGRPWFAYWLYPFPNVAGVWPQFRSPLTWDVFAVTTYFTVSLVFWYLGLVPDLAALRDQAKKRWQRIAYGLLALGWRGSAIHWRRYEKVYLILGGISTPLVLSVHTVVSFDFAVSIVPLWHATIFPPFFVAGAIYSGFAMVVLIAIPVRRWYKLEDFFSDHHLDIMGKVMLATGFLVTYGYFSELWMAWYGHTLYEWGTTIERMFGPYGWSYWCLIGFNCVFPLTALWSRKMRVSPFWMSAICISVLIGMWFERYVIVITLAREYLPSAWGHYAPTLWDYATMVGSLGLFLFLFFLFLRYLPMISITEMRELLPKKQGGGGGHSIMENAP
ncbi:Polysulfide reductase, NrfD [Gemmata sp. SH-PL17]|nr:NrfD/PsrC family molybdoenzyme membrane anchor subunit [Gemmata sp. SH-PL17]AMV24514.1 Polysulfide reductase, NrfD [Gemmata sp. SH-PL17]